MPARRRPGDPHQPRARSRNGGGAAAAGPLVLKRVVLAGLAAGALALVPIAASAHAQLVVSNPQPGSVLQTLPAAVDLVFTESVTLAGRGISVYGPDGKLASSGSARAVSNRLSIPLRDAGAGTYGVIWTVVASDTHPSRGEFTFSVGHTSPVNAPGFGGGNIGLASPLGLVLQALGRWLHFAGFALGFGAAAYALFVARDPRPMRLAVAGAALLFVAEPVSLLAQTASFDSTQTLDADALISALASPFGRVLGLRLAAAFLLWALLGALRQAQWLRWAIVSLGVALSVVDASAAHAVPALPQPIGLALSSLHIFAMSLWVGGVAAYTVSPSDGFRRVAVWSAGLLVLSGATLAVLHFANPLQAMTTAYGVVLMIKLPLVALALWLAWRVRRRAELVALTAVLLAAAFLVSLPPPR